mmetsp:Transcript_636/g.1729  ORF Transcript_636/g.1729 Transcript_636/m.1729 type:complete len:282 (-) Transcript_636:301-1146(-)
MRGHGGQLGQHGHDGWPSTRNHQCHPWRHGTNAAFRGCSTGQDNSTERPCSRAAAVGEQAVAHARPVPGADPARTRQEASIAGWPPREPASGELCTVRLPYSGATANGRTVASVWHAACSAAVAVLPTRHRPTAPSPSFRHAWPVPTASAPTPKLWGATGPARSPSGGVGASAAGAPSPHATTCPIGGASYAAAGHPAGAFRAGHEHFAAGDAAAVDEDDARAGGGDGNTGGFQTPGHRHHPPAPRNACSRPSASRVVCAWGLSLFSSRWCTVLYASTWCM